MQTLTVERGEPAKKEKGGWNRVKALRPPAGAEALDGDVRLVDRDGATVALQVVAVRDMVGRLARVLRTAQWADTMGDRSKSEARLSGIASANLTFGGLPPVPLRKRYGCSRCRVYGTNPPLAALLDEAGERAWETFVRCAPHEAATTRRLVEERGIPEAWQLGSSPWTSGVANNNAGLPYHRDAGNVKGTWSGMIGLKRACEGGYLHLVDYGVWLAIPDGSVTLFDGGQTTHGVTPFRLTHPAGYRFTLVWYARRAMNVCAPNPADEPARAARVATEYAERKART